MAMPYSLWGSGMPMHSQMYAMPSILPSSSYVSLPFPHHPDSGDYGVYPCPYPCPYPYPGDVHALTPSAMVVNPAEAMRDFAEHVLSGDRRGMCSDADKKKFEEWIKNDEYKKAVLEVCKARLDLGWPYNYKALDLLSIFPAGDITGLGDKITKLSESEPGVEGAAHLKTAAKPLLEKIKKEKDKQEEDEAKKRMAAVAEMWGQLWCNQPTQQQLGAQHAGWAGWPYPWRQLPPGVAAQGQVEWNSKAPEGWTPWVLQPVPMQGFPIHGFPQPPK